MNEEPSQLLTRIQCATLDADIDFAKVQFVRDAIVSTMLSLIP